MPVFPSFSLSMFLSIVYIYIYVYTVLSYHIWCVKKTCALDFCHIRCSANWQTDVRHCLGRCNDSFRESGATTVHIILLIGWQILVVKLSV